MMMTKQKTIIIITIIIYVVDIKIIINIIGEMLRCLASLVKGRLARRVVVVGAGELPAHYYIFRTKLSWSMG